MPLLMVDHGRMPYHPYVAASLKHLRFRALLFSNGVDAAVRLRVRISTAPYRGDIKVPVSTAHESS